MREKGGIRWEKWKSCKRDTHVGEAWKKREGEEGGEEGEEMGRREVMHGKQ